MCVGSELRTLLLQTFQFSSVTQSCLILQLQHARFPCPSPTPGWNYSNLCTSSWWCHPVISSSVVPFSSCLQSFPASGFFPMSQFFTSGGQVLKLQHQSFQWIFRNDFLRINWFDLLAVQGPSRVFYNTTVQKHQFFGTQFSNSHIHTSVQFSCSLVSNSLQPHGLQHARSPCLSPTPGIYSNSCQWCHSTISFSVIPFSSHLQSFPASRSFPMSQFFASGDQSIEFSASVSVLPMNIQDFSPLGWTGWISL